MICEECKERKFREMIEESKSAMKRFTAKLREEKYEDKKCKSERQESSELSKG